MLTKTQYARITKFPPEIAQSGHKGANKILDFQIKKNICLEPPLNLIQG